tara:strand:+ start:3430 stop:3834 length:405 start_codon:yes stop_codon:yes gene_type:complete
MDKPLSVELMKKHLRLHNKYVRDDLVISGISKMKKEQVKKMFDRVFTKVGSGENTHYKSKPRRGFDADIPIQDLKALMQKKPKKEKQKKEEKKPDPPKKKKIKIVKRKRDKTGKVISGSVDGKQVVKDGKPVKD